MMCFNHLSEWSRCSNTVSECPFLSGQKAGVFVLISLPQQLLEQVPVIFPILMLVCLSLVGAGLPQGLVMCLSCLLPTTLSWHGPNQKARP